MRNKRDAIAKIERIAELAANADSIMAQLDSAVADLALLLKAATK